MIRLNHKDMLSSHTGAEENIFPGFLKRRSQLTRLHFAVLGCLAVFMTFPPLFAADNSTSSAQIITTVLTPDGKPSCGRRRRFS